MDQSGNLCLGIQSYHWNWELNKKKVDNFKEKGDTQNRFQEPKTVFLLKYVHFLLSVLVSLI